MVVALGLDLSTQQLKGILIQYDDHSYRIIKQSFVTFDDLPFKTKGGVLMDSHNHKVVKAPVLMWVAALDVIFSKFTRDEIAKVDVISGCGQQHGSVYWRRGALQTLKGLDSNGNLHDQLSCAFSVLESPIWMDSSTTDEILELENCVGGAEKLAEITGSAGFERFTGSQILKVKKENADKYDDTERISLVSSFIASLLIQDYSSIDVSDGSGMNLLDIRSKLWDKLILKVIGSDLEEKLGSSLLKGLDRIGKIGNYFVQKYGFSQDCVVSAFTGDNPGSLSSIFWEAGDLMISLGTSDTVFLSIDHPITNTFSHVLCHPNVDNSFMAMIVYKNGSLTREAVRDAFCSSSWDIFNRNIKNTEPGCDGHLGFYFSVPEISPRILNTGFYFFKGLEIISNVPDILHPRLIVESQFMNMKRHTSKIGFHPKQIFVTGGASQNREILQICSDVFGVPILQADENPNSAALGCALRGVAALTEIDLSFVIPRTKCHIIATPRCKFAELYKNLMQQQDELESRIVQIKSTR